MESSDDEAKALPLPVSNYHFVDDDDEPVSFSLLPIQWGDHERIGGEKVRVFLHGSADNGLQKIFKHVIAWKFELSNEKPEILVLSKDNTWIKLQTPKKNFEKTVRSVLVTVHSLHFVMRKPEATKKSLWGHIFKLFSSHAVKLFQSDLEDHLCLISEAFRRNGALAKSKFLAEFLNKNPKESKKPDEDFKAKAVSRFVVNKEDAIVDVAEEDEYSGSDDIYDHACAFCDEGGDLLCCEGRCLRSFHATTKAAVAAKSNCDSLGLTEDEVNAIPNFLCRNCEYKQHQCFICGLLGSSDTSSGAAQVFCCASTTCGRFYHPHCVSRLLHQDNKHSVEELEQNIVEGRSFTCPIHKCCICKQAEHKNDPDLQFAVCRRCPKSYHRKCLPREIAFEGNKKEGIVTRAWTGVLPDQILIYCLEHEMDEGIETPTRDHIKFPKVEEEKNATGVEENKRSNIPSKSSRDSREVELKAVCKPELLAHVLNWKIVDKLHCYVQEGDTIVDICCGGNDFGLLMKNKLEELGRKCLYENYDIVQDKNDINSEKRDWMTVQPEDLPTGSKLIMGLNLSSRIEAALASKFIDKALQFKPKLFLLILPQKSERVAEDILPYYLVWEDSQLLSGKSFYSSGSVNTNARQTKRSIVMRPVLYLWSRSDWYTKHKYIAERYCHISMQQELIDKSCIENPIVNHPTRDGDNFDGKSKSTNELRRHEWQRSPERRKNKLEKKRGGEKVETTTECKSKISPDLGCSAYIRQNFGNCLPGSPMQLRTAYEGKLASTLDDKFRRHNMSDVEHGTGHYGATTSSGSRQHINISDGKPRKESKMRFGNAELGKRVLTSDEKFRRHNMHVVELRTDHYEETMSFSNRQQINSNEDNPRNETDIRSPISLNEPKDSYSSGSNHPPGQNAGHNQMGSMTLSSTSARHRSSASEPSYPINALGMQQPQLDDSKNAKSSFYNGPELPGHSGVPMGFALGPDEAYSLHHSAGWLDE